MRRARLWISSLLIVLVAGGYVTWCSLMPLPDLQASTVQLPSKTTGRSALAWPANGESAVSIVGTSILESYGTQTPVPTASTAKVITALMVLKQKPLKLNEQGPIVTLTANDVALYNNYAAADGSVVKVEVGEQISEYQMLQALMLPSANNIADTLAIWAYGSLDAYATAANSYLSQIGLKGTTVGTDASGLSPTTKSTAHDMAIIGMEAMQEPVLASIASQKTADGLPVVGTIHNVNGLLGANNVIGLKTGNSDEAGGAFVSASTSTVNGRPITIVTALMNSASLGSALSDSLPLLKSAQVNFKQVEIVTADQTAGQYKLPWGGSIAAITNDRLSLQTWNGTTITARSKLQPIDSQSKAGKIVGSVVSSQTLDSKQATAQLRLKADIPQPSIWWRLSHPAVGLTNY